LYTIYITLLLYDSIDMFRTFAQEIKTHVKHLSVIDLYDGTELGSVTLKRIGFFCFPIKHSTQEIKTHVKHLSVIDLYTLNSRPKP